MTHVSESEKSSVIPTDSTSRFDTMPRAVTKKGLDGVEKARRFAVIDRAPATPSTALGLPGTVTLSLL
jgi:hypothetical protein